MHDSIWGRRHMSHAAARVCGEEMLAKRVLVVFLSCLGAVLVGLKLLTVPSAFFIHPYIRPLRHQHQLETEQKKAF